MKKILFAALFLSFIVFLIACGGDSNDSASPDDSGNGEIQKLSGEWKDVSSDFSGSTYYFQAVDGSGDLYAAYLDLSNHNAPVLKGDISDHSVDWNSMGEARCDHDETGDLRELFLDFQDGVLYLACGMADNTLLVSKWSVDGGWTQFDSKSFSGGWSYIKFQAHQGAPYALFADSDRARLNIAYYDDGWKEQVVESFSDKQVFAIELAEYGGRLYYGYWAAELSGGEIASSELKIKSG